MNEDERQVLHIISGLAAIALVEIVGVQLSAYAIGIVLVLGLMTVHLKLSGFHLGPLEWLVERFERPGVTPGYGAMTLTAGCLAILTLLSSKEQIVASLFILGVGDAASTIVGRRSKRKLPYSRVKTYQGTAAFFICCLPAALAGGYQAVLVAGAAAIAESLESNIDDNLIISVVCVVFFRLLGA